MCMTSIWWTLLKINIILPEPLNVTSEPEVMSKTFSVAEAGGCSSKLSQSETQCVASLQYKSYQSGIVSDYKFILISGW